MAAIKTRMKTRHFLLSPRYNSQTCIFGTANSRCSPPTNNGWHAEIFFSTPHCIFVSLVPSPFYPALGQRGWPAAVVVVLRCCSHGGSSSSCCCCWSRCCDFRACSGDAARRPWGAAAALQQRERRHILAWGPQPKTLVPGFCLSSRDGCHTLVAAPASAGVFEGQNPMPSSPALADKSVCCFCRHSLLALGQHQREMEQQCLQWRGRLWRCCCCCHCCCWYG